MTAHYVSSASEIIDDFDAALVFVARHVLLLGLERPHVAIAPVTVLGHDTGERFSVQVSGAVAAPLATERTMP